MDANDLPPAPPEGLQRVERRGRGRPTKYAPNVCDAVAALVREGASTWRIAREISVSRPTLYAWACAHPEFRRAIGRAISLPVTTAEELQDSDRRENREHEI
jgi:hypothetical protein